LTTSVSPASSRSARPSRRVRARRYDDGTRRGFLIRRAVPMP
jgi:hypothetical protein